MTTEEKIRAYALSYTPWPEQEIALWNAGIQERKMKDPDNAEEFITPTSGFKSFMISYKDNPRALTELQTWYKTGKIA